jgi:uncharacterized RDD family membrane protein YckC
MWPFEPSARDERRFVCPVCDEYGLRRQQQELYGHPVCRACARSFFHRRAAAWLVDRSAFFGAGLYALFQGDLLGVPAAGMAALFLISWVGFALRDGYRGRSPGKALLGLHVITEADGKPADWVHSFGRHMLLFFPVLPLIAAVQMGEGHRLGDGIAGTRVVWTRYAASRVFRR